MPLQESEAAFATILGERLKTVGFAIKFDIGGNWYPDLNEEHAVIAMSLMTCKPKVSNESAVSIIVAFYMLKQYNSCILFGKGKCRAMCWQRFAFSI